MICDGYIRAVALGYAFTRMAGTDLFNASQMCRVEGKQFSDFLISDRGKCLTMLAHSSETTAIQSVLDGPLEIQGNYVHLVVALSLAKWCSEEMGRAFSTIVSFENPRSQMIVEQALFRALVSNRLGDLSASRPVEKSSFSHDDALVWYERYKPVVIRVGRRLLGMGTWSITFLVSLIAYLLSIPHIVLILGTVIAAIVACCLVVVWVRSRSPRLVPNRSNVDMSLLVASARNAMQPKPIITRKPSVPDPIPTVDNAKLPTIPVAITPTTIAPSDDISEAKPVIFDYFVTVDTSADINSNDTCEIRICRFIRPADQQEIVQDRGKKYTHFVSVKTANKTKCPLFLSKVREDLVTRRKIQMVGNDRWRFKLMDDFTPKSFMNAVTAERQRIHTN